LLIALASAYRLANFNIDTMIKPRGKNRIIAIEEKIISKILFKIITLSMKVLLEV